MEALKDLQLHLTEHGFFLINCEHIESAIEIINSFGVVFRTENIVSTPDSPVKLASNREMALHTDYPGADYVAWFCESPASQGGESIIADTREILNSLSKLDIEHLKNINLKIPSLTEKKYYQYPLLSDKGVYFADWLLDVNWGELHQSLKNFILKIQCVRQQSFLLKKGDLLFIDNTRMLHGRNEFNEADRKRNLIRYWVSAASC